MEVKCPTCTAQLEVEDDQPAFNCPACGANLEVVVNQFGLTIVGVRKPPSGEAGEPGENDLIVQDCRTWQMRALFLMGIGFAAAMILFLHLKNAYLSRGLDFWMDKDNLIPIPFLLLLSIVPMVLGGIAYRSFGRKAEAYLKSMTET